MLPIEEAGDTGLQRRERRKKQVSRERDGHAADRRSGRHWSPETGETEETGLKGKRRTCCRSKKRVTLVSRDGRDRRNRSQGKETDMLPIEEAGDTGLQRRERRKKQVSRERDGHAADRRSGRHWSPETGETEETGLKGKRRTCCRSKKRVTLVSRDGRDRRNRSQGKETDMLPIEEAGDTGLQRRERRKKQVSRERDGHAADRRSGRHWSPETGETEETGLKGKRRTCCRSKKQATLVSRDGRDGRNRSQGKETDMLPIEEAGDTGLQRRERRKKQVSRERDGHAADRRSRRHWSPETGETEETGLKGKRRTCCRSKKRATLVSRDGRDGRNRSQGKETDMLPIEEAGDTGLQRRERRKKQVSRERDGHAADRRSGRHWSPETGETEETGLKGKRRTCCRSKKRATLVSRDGRDGRNRSQGKETDMLPIEEAGDTGLQRRERRKKQVSRERDGHAADRRSGRHWSPETGETEETGLKGKRRTCCRSKKRATLVSRDGRDGRNRSQGKETDMLPIEEAGDTGLQRRDRRKKQVSRERDGHAADRRSGRHWSPETGETEETGLKGKRRTCCRSKE